MTTIADIIEEINALKREQTVYSEIITFLSQFISSDTHQPNKGMQSPVGGELVIPEASIDLIKIRIAEIINDIEKQIESLTKKSVNPDNIIEKKIGKKKRIRRALTEIRKENAKNKK
jgi:hypothetical protein